MTDDASWERAALYAAFVDALAHVSADQQLSLLSDPCVNSLSVILDELPAFVGLATLDGTIVACSREAFRILGEQRERVIGTNLREWYVEPEQRHRLVTSLYVEPGPRMFEAEIRRTNGLIVRVRFWSILFHQQGLVLAFGYRIPVRQWETVRSPQERMRVLE